MARVADSQTFFDEIEGYCTTPSVHAGEPVQLHVSTAVDTYDVTVERWGAERVEVWSAARIPGRFTPPPPDADAAGCRWPVSLEIPVDDSWRPGFHLVTLTASGAAERRDVAHAWFVVRPVRRASNTLLILATNTWNAYNTWGGCSLYTGGHQVSFRRPLDRGLLCRPEAERDDRKARPVRFRESPDAAGQIFQDYRTHHGYPSAIGSTGWFTHERRFVEWAEGAGFSFDMAISSDLDEDPTLLDGYDLVLGVGHDEYWTAGGRDMIDAHIAAGGAYATFSGNTMFWQVRRTEGGAHMICHKYLAHENDPVVNEGRPEQMSGMWADPLVARPEWTTIGGGSAFGLYHRFGMATPQGAGGFSIVEPDHWMLDGTGLGYGDVVGIDDGVVGYETLGCPLQFDDDHRLVSRPIPGMPADVTIVGFTLSSNLAAGEYPVSIAALGDQGDLEFVASRLSGSTSPEHLAKWRRGNAVMLTCRPHGPTGGEVVTIGSTDWVFGLANDAQIAQITSNVLTRWSPASDGSEV